MLAQMELWTAAERDAILHESLPHFVQNQDAREKLQQMLGQIFMADSEYGSAEQTMTHKIGDWLRAASEK
jgi:uncharacterized tellurite resistance protein B-like protein